jgi:hypothetical protein
LYIRISNQLVQISRNYKLLKETTMKKFLTFLLLLIVASCSSDDTNGNRLPPETQVGANTFGCLINGKTFIPRSGNNSLVFPLSGVDLF